MICTNCGSSVASEYRFCPRCGKPCTVAVNAAFSQPQIAPQSQQINQVYNQQMNQAYTQQNQVYSQQSHQYYNNSAYGGMRNYNKHYISKQKLREDSISGYLVSLGLSAFFAVLGFGLGIASLLDEPESAWVGFAFFVGAAPFCVFYAFKLLCCFKSDYKIYRVPCIDRSIEDDGESTAFLVHLKDPCSSDHKIIYPVSVETMKYTNVGDFCYLVIYDNDKMGKKVYPEKMYELSPDLKAMVKNID